VVLGKNWWFLVFLNFLGGFDSFWQFLFVLVGCCWFLVVFSCLWWFLVGFFCGFCRFLMVLVVIECSCGSKWFFCGTLWFFMVLGGS